MKTLLLTLFVALCAAPAWAGPRLAILDFTVASSDPSHEPLGQGLRSMVSTDLTSAPDVVVVERDRLQAVLDELKLQQSKAVDQKTALEVGRLLGATHLVDGSVTVQGEQMRLDVRLLDVQNGTVLLGEQVEGERLAFFELEKALVKKLVVALAIQLAPKERAAIGKLHTADWEAFVAFSEGVSAFDEEKYEEALAALDRALVVDGEFDLAELTQREFTAIIERLETRSTALRTAKFEEEKLELSQEAAAQLAMINGLEELAALDGADHLQDRLTAIGMLHALYRGRKLSALRSEMDEFRNQRLADHYQRRYMIEAREHAADVQLDPPGSMYVKDEAWRESFDELKGQLFFTRYANRKPEVRQDVQLRRLRDCTSSSKWGQGLYLDLGERVKLCLERQEIARALGADDEWESSFAWGISHELVDAGMFGEATKLLLRRAESLDKANQIDSIRRRVEALREADQVIKKAARPERVREAVLLGGGRSFYGMDMVEFAPDHVGGKEMTPMGRWGMGRLRSLYNRVDNEPYLLVGDRPFWPMGSLVMWTTGHRPDPIRTEQLTYYRPETAQGMPTGQPVDRPAIAIYGERHHSDLAFDLTWTTTPDNDWWPLNARHNEGAKTHKITANPAPLGILVGAHDLKVDLRRIPGEDPVRHRPFRAWVVVIDTGEVRIEQIGKVGADYKNEFETKVIARTARKDGAKDETRVSLRVSADGAVNVSLNGRGHKLKIPDYKPGFTGFMMTGVGYGALSELELE